MTKRTIIGIILIVAALLQLANLWNIIQWEWLWRQPWTSYIAPTLLLYVGVTLLISSFRHHRDQWLQRPVPQGDEGKRIRCSVRFGGDEYIYHGETFHGAQLDTLCGGLRLDLRDAVITEDEAIDIQTVFGGIEIFVPRNVNVKVKSRSLFGGVGNEAINLAEKDTPCLHIVVRNYFGGVSIKK
ncbi:MAG: hypothetical protein IKX36_09975 [Prevotella sp.]|nr:hypothetical protein [Prevotella sp.]